MRLPRLLLRTLGALIRWLLIHPGPAWSVADVFAGWSEALTGLGEQVEEYPLDATLRFFNGALAETGELKPCGCPGVRRFLDRDQAIRLAVDPILAAASRWWPDVILCIVRVLRPAVAAGDPPRTTATRSSCS